MVKAITAEMGEKCLVDVDKLHENLLQLPGEKYLELYHKMQLKVTGYSPFISCCTPDGNYAV